MRQGIATQLHRIKPYMRFLTFLLVMAAGFFAWMSVMGCTQCEKDSAASYSSQVSAHRDAPAPKVRAKLIGFGSDIHGGQRVRRRIQPLEADGATGNEKVSFTWTPPEGASSFDFYSGEPPDNPQGPPPYVWTNPSTEVMIEFSYQMPQMPEGLNHSNVSETLATQCEGSNPTVEQLNTPLITGSAIQAQAGAVEDNAEPIERLPVDSAAEDMDVWETVTWYDPKGMELTTGVCQSWIDVLSSDEFFFAVQMPVTSSGPITESQSLSLVMGEQNPGLLVIMTNGWLGEVYRSDVEMRNERATFMANALPEEAGMGWVALGLPDDAPDCDDDLSWPADQWSFITSLTLDLRALPNEGLGTHLTNYMCYEGESLPWVDMLAQSLARRAGLEVASYQDDDIICVGPQLFRLPTGMDWELQGTSFQSIAVTETLSLQHGVMNAGETDKTFNYVIESTLDVDWTVYAGTYDEPNLEQPIGSQIVAPPGDLYFWLISGELNGTTPAGSHSVELTLTDTASPEDSQLAVDAIWVGEAPGSASNPFLPLIVR